MSDLADQIALAWAKERASSVYDPERFGRDAARVRQAFLQKVGAMPEQQESCLPSLLKFLDSAGMEIGVTLRRREALRAEHICFMVKPEDQKAAGVIAGVYRLVCQTSEGRKAVRDLGFEPLLEGIAERGEGS